MPMPEMLFKRAIRHGYALAGACDRVWKDEGEEMSGKRFYVDDVPLARSTDEFPPELYADNPRPKQVHDSRFETGPIIRQMRANRGVSQEELAKRINRSRSYMAVLETRTGSCRFDTLAMIARALGYEIVFRKKEDKK